MHDMLHVLSATSLAAQDRYASMKWMLLVPASAMVEKPQSIIDCRAPTVPEKEAEAGQIPIKYNFNKTF
eukprot:2663496-Ditylum_brightwellii.AAC.1